MSNMFSLEGKIALVTGASYGIGFAIACAMSDAGATIVFNDIKQELVDKGITAYAEKGIKAHGYVCDVTDEAAVNALVAKIEEEVGVIDILVNNAGITRDMLAMRLSDEAWDAVIATNLTAAFVLTRAVLRPMMKARFGRIINMSSVVGSMGNAGQANYAAAKAGLIGMSKSVAQEVASRGITVNCIAPGFIDTDMTRALAESDREKLAERIPARRLGQTDDIAGAVLYLASDLAAYVTGAVLPVNGGLFMG